MGVYLPNIEIPENCIFCDLSHEDGWCPAKQTYTDSYTFKTCPIVPVPEPHGRLGDLDELVRYKERYVVDADKIEPEIRYFVGTEYIVGAPTIIPAEPYNEKEETK